MNKTKAGREEIIRSDRIEIRERGAATLRRANGTQLDVVNFSAFGIAAHSHSAEPPPGPAFDAELSVRGVPFQTVTLRFVYAQEQENGSKLAFEVTGAPIDSEGLRAMLDAAYLNERQANRLLAASELRPSFRQAVFELHEFLAEMRDGLAALELGWGQLPRKLRERRERGAILSTTAFLKESLAPRFEALEETLLDLNGSERMHHLKYFKRKLTQLVSEAPLVQLGGTARGPIRFDFEASYLIHQNDFEGGTLFSQCLHKYYTGVSSATALRSRSAFLEGALARGAAETARAGKKFRIAAIGSGAAIELVSFLERLPADSGEIALMLVDFELGALQFAQERLRETLLARGFSGVKITYRHLELKSFIAAGLAGDADLRAAFDLVYASSLFDYLPDAPAELCLSHMLALLAPGGRALAGNFDPALPQRGELEIVLDWNLVYRSSGELLAIAKKVAPQASFARNQQAGKTVPGADADCFVLLPAP